MWKFVREFQIMFKKKAVVIGLVLLMATLFFYNICHLLQATYQSTLAAFHAPRKDVTGGPHIPVFNSTEDFLIVTPGCTIPNYEKTLKFKEHKLLKETCYDRIVFVEKNSEEEISFRLDSKKKHISKDQRLECFYQFAHRIRIEGSTDETLSYTKLKPFKNGTTVQLESEIVLVECDLVSTKNVSRITHSYYKDAYLVLKKIPDKNKKKEPKDNKKTSKEKCNVLVIIMDTMSRARAYHSLPKTVKYLKKHHWLDYRGYQKIAFNSFPNTMAILAGLNASSAYRACAHGMDQCRHRLIWEYFRRSGYVTAFGEEYLRLPDTFSPYKGFKVPPTDHYARPFFLVGEYSAGNLICTNTKPSGQHLIEYASQFAKVYRNDTFFGYFWINSFSHNLQNLPNLFENSLLEFFVNLNNSGVLDNTFVFFLSDHGIRFGEMRLPKESFYEERMPMFFIWVPNNFRETYPDEYYNLQLNQYRLTSPYNLHATLWQIMYLNNREVRVIAPESCPHCQSLTEEISLQENCRSAHIDEKWCTCHDMIQTEKHDDAADVSLQLAVELIQNRSRSTETKKCTECIPLTFDKVIRSHRYSSQNKTYYIIAFSLNPSNLGYEATVEYSDGNFEVLDPTDTISAYNSKGSCVLHQRDRAYCVCRTIKKCK